MFWFFRIGLLFLSEQLIIFYVFIDSLVHFSVWFLPGSTVCETKPNEQVKTSIPFHSNKFHETYCVKAALNSSMDRK